MIKLEPCRSCGRLLYVDALAGVDIRTETNLVDAEGAIAAAMTGAILWAVRLTDGRPTSFTTPTPAMLGALSQPPTPAGYPSIVAEHRCTKRGTEAGQAARQGSASRPSVESGSQAPKARVAPNGTASSASQATPSQAPGVPAAVKPRFSRARTHPCHACEQPVNLDSAAAYVAELGATIVFAAHADC